MAPDTPDIPLREFGFSESFLREGNRMLMVLFPFSLFFAGVFLWYLTGCRIATAFASAGMCFLMIGPLLVIEIILLNRRSRKLKVCVDEDKIVKQCGKKQHALFWKDITGMKTTYRKGGAIFQITLYPNKPNIPMYIFGFTEIEALAALIEERTSEGVVPREKHWKLDWRNPFVMLAVALPTMAATLVIVSMGDKAEDMFFILVTVTAGSIWLVWQPLTKSDIGLKWLDLALAILLLVLGINRLIRFLGLWSLL